MILFDTNVVSELIKPDLDVRVESWFTSLDIDDIHTSVITLAELRYGVAILQTGRKKQKLIDALDALFANEFAGRILAFDEPSAMIYADIMVVRRKMGRPIMQADAQIAAIAKSHNASLATRNTADFEHTGIPLTNPWET
jgi:toxin FitB